jgi:hypothetical protein
LIVKYCFFGILLLFISSSNQKLYSEECSIEILSNYKVDACEIRNERDVLLSLDAGEIKKSDQFFGYELAIIIDTNKIRITDVATFNTLSEFMDQTVFRTYSDTVVVSAATLGSIPIWGDLQVVALSGYYKDTCTGSAIVKIDYFYPTDEFTRDIVYKSRQTEVIAEIEDKNNRRIEISSKLDTLKEFNEDSVAICEFDVDLIEKRQVKEFEFKVELLDGKKFKILDILVQENELEILEKNEIENGWKVRASLKQSLDKYTMTCTVKDKEKNSNKDRLFFEILNVNDCACITRFEGDNIMIEGDQETSVKDISQLEINKKIIIDRLIYIDENRPIEDVFLMDNLGRKVDQSLYIVNDKQIDVSRLDTGMYLVVFKIENMKKSFIVIKN